MTALAATLRGILRLADRAPCRTVVYPLLVTQLVVALTSGGPLW